MLSASASSAQVLRRAQHKCFGRLSTSASTSSAQALRRAQQPRSSTKNL